MAEQIAQAFLSHYYPTLDANASQLAPLYVSRPVDPSQHNTAADDQRMDVLMIAEGQLDAHIRGSAVRGDSKHRREAGGE
jgi:hypothetical protein